jgi:aryl-alcohol dehydrogenase-like predicted oxidoreductase
MHTTTLGRAGVTVPRVCLGTMTFGTTVPPSTAMHLLDAAVDEGLTFLDTANNYAFWVDGATGDESEAVLGRWLRARGSRVRDKVVLATKVGARPRPGSRSLASVLGLSAAAVTRQVEDSLRRLGVDHADLVYAHIDDGTPVEETLGAFDALVRGGKVGAIGWSNTTPARLHEAARAADSRGLARYTAVQQRWTYLTPEPAPDLGPHVVLDEPMRDCAARLGVTALGYCPLLGGTYSRSDREPPDGYRHAGTGTLVGAVRDTARELGTTPEAVVLSWMAGSDPPVVPVPGVSSEHQVRSAAEGLRLTLPAQHRHHLDETRRREHP